MHTQPSQSNAGGVVICIGEKLDHFEGITSVKLMEILKQGWNKGKKGKNFLCRCVYRHLDSDVTSFAQ